MTLKDLGNVFISLLEISADAENSDGKRIPAAHTSHMSYHWFAMMGAWSHSLR